MTQCGAEEFVDRAGDRSVRVRTPKKTELRGLAERRQAMFADDGDATVCPEWTLRAWGWS
ncbi:hypothetical protein [Amycolatopsis panacis]|uniref:Uncharacterized protein n=1 Tax=Amycolatopsis panacis TaxID=2340917 RepID=A0A419HV68_9PSEU|nr:hypothetical protein [Amycolatopsis panacis]RJQ80818.1 hypothetical protein D5S19_24555 [Amycolatopsis panacis]